LNSDDRQNNIVYKVKAVVKSMATNTFSSTGVSQLKNTPLTTIALDKDSISDKDNFESGIATQTSVYRVKQYHPIDTYYSKFNTEDNTRIILGDEVEY